MFLKTSDYGLFSPKPLTPGPKKGLKLGMFEEFLPLIPAFMKYGFLISSITVYCKLH